MFDVIQDLRGETSQVLLAWAVSGAAKAFFVLLIASILSMAMRRTSAAKRHLLWSLAVGIVLLFPLGASLVPQLPIEIPGVRGWPFEGPTVGSAGGTISKSTRAEGGYAWRGGRTIVDATPLEVRIEPVDVLIAPVETLVEPAQVLWEPIQVTIAPTDGLSRSEWLLGGWLFGLTLVLGHLGLAGSRIRKLERSSRIVATGPLHDAMALLAGRLGLTRTPILLVGNSRCVPMTWGIFRARILLPEGADLWPAWRLEAVLLHELGHVARRDYLSQVFAQLACAVHWFNPLVWRAANRMRVEREHACDDLVISLGHEPSSYARDLIELARELRPARLAATAAVCFARPNRLRDRLVSLMDEKRDRRPISPKIAARATGSAIGFALLVAAVAPTSAADTNPESADTAAPSLPLLSSDGPVSGSESEPSTVVGAGRMEPPLEVAGVPPSMRTQTFDLTLSPLENETPVQQSSVLCGPSDGESGSHNHSTSNDVTTIEMRYGDCRTDVRIEGEIEFSDDFSSVAGMSRNGLLRIDVTRDGERRRVEVRPGQAGPLIVIDGVPTQTSRPEFEWQINGRDTAYDASAQLWFASALTDLFRSSTYKARARTVWLLQERGVEGVLTEVQAIWSGHTQARYLSLLLEEGELSQPEIRRVFEVASREIESDHALGGVLGTAAERYSFDVATRGAFIDAAATLESDHQHAGVLEIALGRDDLSQENLEALLSSATVGLESDHLMAGILTGLVERYALDPDLRGPFLEAAGTLDSDHQKAAVYGTVLEQDGLTGAELGVVLEAASTIVSDHNLAGVLLQATEHDLGDPVLRAAFLTAAGTIESDHNRSEVLAGALDLPGLTDGDMAEILAAASNVESSHLLSGLLGEVAARNPSGAATRSALIETAASIDSDHNLVSALIAIAQLELDNAELVSVLDISARELESDHLMAELLIDVSDHYEIEGRVREAFLRALDTVDSTHLHDRVASKIVRR